MVQSYIDRSYLMSHCMRLRQSPFVILLTIVSCFGITETKAQQSDSVPPAKHEGYIKSYWTNGLRLVSSPVRWKADEWVKFGGTALVTGAIISMDEAISNPFFNWQSDAGQDFGDAGKTIGSIPVQVSISGLSIAVGAIAHNRPLENFGLDNLQAQIYTGGITWLAKVLANRSRPYTGNGAYDWKGPFYNGNNDTHSFFSGHASLAFSTATMVFLHSHKKWWVGLISYSAATGISLSRIQNQDHWASDVVLGAVIGSAVANFVYREQEKRRNNNSRLTVIP